MTDLTAREVIADRGRHDYRSPMATTGLEVRVREAPELVDIDRLTTSLHALAAALRDLEGSSSVPAKRDRTVWVVQDLGYHEPFLSVQLTARTADHPHADPELLRPVQTLVDGVRQLTRTPELPPFYSDWTIKKLLRFAGTGGGIDAVSLATLNGVVGERHELSPAVLANARQAVAPRETSLGTVTGTLDVLNARGTRSRDRVGLSVSDALTKRSVSGTADRQLIDDLRAAWGTRVAVIGSVTRNDRGQPVRVTATTIERLPNDDSGRPSTASLLGADPDWLGGQDVDDYVSAARRS